jgi:hypothetical protein
MLSYKTSDFIVWVKKEYDTLLSRNYCLLEDMI